MRGHYPTGLDELAASQSGVLSRKQALAAGLGPAAIGERLSRGRWQRMYTGVYATFTGEINRSAALWAGVLQAGHGAVLSHETAAEADGLRSRECTMIHICVAAERHIRPVSGLVVRRSERIEQARHPARTPPRTRIEETVLDLTQSAATFDDAFDWLCRACGGRFTTADRLLHAMALRKKLRWRPELAAALGEISSGVHSGLEFRYARDVERAHRLPRATRQARQLRGGRAEYRDNLYAPWGVVVETDGRASHPAAARWRDIARDNAAIAAGLATLRYGWPDVTQRPCDVAREVAAALRARGWPGTPSQCGPGCSVRNP